MRNAIAITALMVIIACGLYITGYSCTHPDETQTRQALNNIPVIIVMLIAVAAAIFAGRHR